MENTMEDPNGKYYGRSKWKILWKIQMVLWKIQMENTMEDSNGKYYGVVKWRNSMEESNEDTIGQLEYGGTI